MEIFVGEWGNSFNGSRFHLETQVRKNDNIFPTKTSKQSSNVNKYAIALAPIIVYYNQVEMHIMAEALQTGI